MAEDIVKKISIKKKKNNRPLYYGIAIETGELLTVNEVERGLACGCICPSCETRLEARKGEKKAYHFAHDANKECLYGAEIAVYRAFYELLKKSKQFFVPDAVLSFNSNKADEIVKKGSLISLDKVEFYNDPINYPPELLCYSGKNCLQIILNIESYYTMEDKRALKEYGRQRNIAVVSIDVEDLDSMSSFSALQPFADLPEHKTWIYNRLVEQWDQRYSEVAVEPTSFESGYVCLAQKNQFKNVYSARIVDCMNCQYCYDHMVDKSCLAPSYIDHIDDFYKPESECKREFYVVNQLKPIKRIADFRCPNCNAPLIRKVGPKGVFAGCSRFPKCRGSRQVEQTTEQVIIQHYRRNR